VKLGRLLAGLAGQLLQLTRWIWHWWMGVTWRAGRWRRRALDNWGGAPPGDWI